MATRITAKRLAIGYIQPYSKKKKKKKYPESIERTKFPAIIFRLQKLGHSDKQLAFEIFIQ